jgi:diacylglycerol O-acyltransferase
MANPDRLTALDSAFLHLEDNSTAHMHVASVMIFEGTAPTAQELVDHVMNRLHLVPRYRQRLAHVPFQQGRPVWTDDPYFNPRYHIRHTALPKPADEQALKRRDACSRSGSTAPSRCGRSGSWSGWPAGASR